jgi:hypothetical protein
MPPKKERKPRSEEKPKERGEKLPTVPGEPIAPNVDRSWLDGLVDVSDLGLEAQCVVHDQEAMLDLGALGDLVKDGSAQECDEQSDDGGLPDLIESDDDGDEAESAYVVWRGKSTGVVKGQFSVMRQKYLVGCDDPEYDEYESVEAATEAWNAARGYKLKEVRESIQRKPTEVRQEAVPTSGSKAQPERPSLADILKGAQAATMQPSPGTAASKLSKAPATPKIKQVASELVLKTPVKTKMVDEQSVKAMPPETPKVDSATETYSPFNPGREVPVPPPAIEMTKGSVVGVVLMLLMALPIAYLQGSGYMPSNRVCVASIAAAAAVAATTATHIDGPSQWQWTFRSLSNLWSACIKATLPGDRGLGLLQSIPNGVMVAALVLIGACINGSPICMEAILNMNQWRKLIDARRLLRL